ncbi:hypothetical protein ACFXPH_04770, partial [Streptomyces goshikiensis]
MTNPSVEPVRMTNPVRLDDLIEAIKKIHTDTLEQLSGAVVGGGGGGRGGGAAISMSVYPGGPPRAPRPRGLRGPGRGR